MELIFEVHDAEEGGYFARALGHAIFTQAETWEELRANVLEAVSLHFEHNSAHPRLVQLHYVKDEVGYTLDSGRRPQSGVGQTIAFCGLSGTGSAPALTDDKKRSSVPQGRCQSGHLSQADSPKDELIPVEAA
jgi:predicted RNase H-like HicB family nuclease